MMQKVLVLFASPNNQGNTAALLNLYLEQYTNQFHDKFEINTLPIYKQHISPCIGCNVCRKNGFCPKNKKDDVALIFDEIKKSDHVIIASPVYFSGFPAPLKALIDRTQQNYNKKIAIGKFKNLKLRKGSLVVTCGSNDDSIFEFLNKCTKQFFDCMDIAFTGKIYAMNTDNSNEIKIYS
ncbi:MAG: flavodoxin family protein [Oscillospiraceae bacterium]|nr:flavodoxin family protein [Oscillospiraceae bacterium]